MSNPKKILLKTGKWLGIILLVLLGLFVAIVLLIRTEWGQNKIVGYATNFVSEKTNTRVDIERIFITFSGNIQIEGVYLEDQKQDTLVYFRSLEAGVGFKSLLNNHIAISRIDLDGLRANIRRSQDSTFNFDFIIEAFASTDTATTQEPADTASSPPPTISIGPVNLTNINLTYIDSLAGMDADLRLGNLELSTDDLNLEKMRFELDNILLENTQVKVVQFLPPPPSPEDTSSSPLPYISFNEIALRNIEVRYKSEPDSLDARARIGDFSIGESDLNLALQDISIENIKLLESDIRVKLPKQSKADTTQRIAETDSAKPFEWPAWKVKLNQLLLDKNTMILNQGSRTAQPGVFDASQISLRNLTIDLQDVLLKDREASLNLENLAFNERSGFVLNKLAFETKLQDEELDVKNFQLLTANSELNMQLSLGYPSIDSLIANPKNNTRFGLGFGETSLSVKDAYYFADSLRYDTLIQSIEEYPMKLGGGISGSYKDIAINNFKLDWLTSTALSVNGTVKDLPDTNNLKVDFNELNISTNADDLGLLSGRKNPKESLPRYVVLKTRVNGNAANINAFLTINTPDGFVKFDGNVSNILSTPAYKGLLEVDTLNIGKFAQNQELEPISLTLDFNGSGKELETLALNAKLDFQQLLFRDYDYNGLALKADINNKKADLALNFSDKNLDFDLKLNAILDTVKTMVDLSLDLRGADLKDLHLQANPMKVAALLNASFEGNADKFNSQLTIKRGIVVQQDKSYRLDSVFASLSNSKEATDLRLNSEVISGMLKGNTSIQNLISSLQSYQKQMMGGDSIQMDSTYQKLDMTADFYVVNSPIISEVFIPELQRLDTIHINMAFKPSEEILKVNLTAPGILYGESEVSNLFLDLDATRSSTDAQFGFERITSGPIDIYATRLNLNLDDGKGAASLSIKDAQQQDVFYTALDVSKTGQSTILKLGVEKLILNSKPWTIPESNEIRIDPDLTRFTDFTLTRNGQQLSIESLNEGEKEIMKLVFSDFNLAALFSILNAGNSPISGTLGGNVVLNDLTGTPAFVADVTLNNLGAMGNPIGTLNLKANNSTANQYVVDLSLKGKDADLDLEGEYSISGESQNLDLALNINQINLSLVEAFVPDQLSNTSGYLTGDFKVSGSTSEPKYKGNLSFKNVGFKSVFLGSTFTLGDEKIELDNQGVYLNKFTLKDEASNTMVLNGDIRTEDMLNPTFNLSLKANKFQALNSTREDNDLVYGKVIVSLDIDVKGDLNLPKVNAKVGLERGTELSYIVPASQAEIQERQGIVRFANMKDSTDIISSDEVSSQTITGLDVAAYLKIDPKTTFNVILDEQSGDKLTITGEANLNYSLSPNGNMDLSGSYELSDGSYNLNLYELVKKKFEITPGSRIVWSGDPMNAELNLTAVYNVKTSAADLMIYEASAQGASASKYNQKLPFEVLLNIDGTISKPEISFGLDMPDDSKDAIGGSVYRRVQQLEEDESELNKQVFALIVFNRFLPSDATEGTGGGTEQLARSSVSKLLSGQLNKLSEKYIEGFELNFDLDSYQDYQSGNPEQRTDLNVSLQKSLFADRVVVQVGSTVGIEGEQRSNEIIGNVSLEYLLTEEGQYRLKAFSKNQYQDFLEGQVTITGLAILFNKEFDTLKELLEKQEKKKKEESKE
ncbi:translocation/assembly module TamB domain-containing protein [Owenweeksia hongkongensis]|uniref:translocation/assembly module TamB domain-containing protein n=1 Tax=Owenweeksia hongkongensis TaxID=253245 RepID=UPI003A91CE7F